jgi:gas vesicle protein
MKFRDGLFLGVLLGIASAFLYAPKSGDEVRDEVKDKLDSVPKNFFALLESIVDLSSAVLDFAKDAFDEQKGTFTSAVSSGIDAAKKKREEFSSHISPN